MSTFGPDFYHGNFAGDGPVPVARLVGKVGFVILKVSQGTSYSWASSWYPPNAKAVRAAGLILGGYHMLDGESGSGAQQAAYFLEHCDPQPGDIVPCMDFEASGRKSASIQAYRDRAVEFIKAVHDAGFEAMIYGHADVKAAWSDWRSSGADYWWVPGDSPHDDIGPRGPDLWQYGPYTAPAGFPLDPGGIGRSDMSVVMTALPIIGGDELALLDEDDQNELKGLLRRLRKQGPPGASVPPKVKTGFDNAKEALEAAEGPPGPEGPQGKQGIPGKAAVLKPGAHLVVTEQ